MLSAAACRLAEFGALLHPDHRADLVFDQVLRAPIPGMNHAERAFLAAAAFARHTGANVVREPQTMGRLLSYERPAAGAGPGRRPAPGLPICPDGAPPLLAKSRLRLDGETLVLSADHDGGDLLLGEQTAKRASTLASVLGPRAGDSASTRFPRQENRRASTLGWRCAGSKPDPRGRSTQSPCKCG